jgi:uncharacterized delta-60 repeat protein
MSVRTLNRNLAVTAASLFIFIVIAVSPICAQLDPTFGNNGVTLAYVGQPAGPIGSFVLPDGKILVVGRAGCCGSGPGSSVFFFKFNSNGTPDTTYSMTGWKQLSMPYASGGITRASARQSDGKIVLAGGWFDDSFIARFNEDGSLDTSFNGTGFQRVSIAPFASDGMLSLTIQPDGKILAAGYADVSQNWRLAFMRCLPNGTLDPSLGGGGLFVHEAVSLNSQVRNQSVYVNSAGKILVANPYEIGGGKVRRFNFDGSVDGSFTIVPYPYISGFQRTVSYLQPDDKILVSGVITTNATAERANSDVVVSRYNGDGTVDTGFGQGGSGSVTIDLTSKFEDEPLGFALTADGQIIVAIETDVGPNRTTFTGNILSYARLSSDGTLLGKTLGTPEQNSLTEPSFTTVLPDGKILTAFTMGSQFLLAKIVGVPMQSYIFHALPYLFSSGAPGVDAKPSVFRPSEANWLTYYSSGIQGFGQANDIPVSDDYIGSIIPDYAFFRPSNGTWYISRQSSGVVNNPLTIQWGLSGDIPTPADFDGDGKADLAVFRPSNGVWYIRNSSDESIRFVQWGLNGDKPAVGDFDGDGHYDIGVFRPSDGNWYIIRSSDGGSTILHFGLDGDIPVQEDYDGDQKFDIAVYRPSSGIWYRLNSSDGAFVAIQWGLAGDIPVPADYDRDRKMNIAVWRPSNGYWYILNPDIVSMHFYVHGNPTDIPLPGKF